MPFKNFVRRDARDPRARVRQARAEEEVKVFNGVVRALNALSCGFAGGGPKPNGLGTNIALQEAVAKQLESKVKDFAQGQPCRRSLLSNCSVCTSVVCMCGAYYSLDFLERGLFAAGLSGSLAAVDEAKAVPLVAERLSLPARGAVVRLVDVLPGRLAVAVRAGDVGAMGCEVDSMVFPCLATVPMGWNWSVLCTQEAHRFVLYSRTSARKQDELGAPDKVINRPRHGLYVDDFMQLVTEPALRRARHLRGEYLDATRAVGWVAKPAKMIDFTARPTDLLGICSGFVRPVA